MVNVNAILMVISCEGDLKCFQRSGYKVVPGCSGEGGLRDVYGKGICYKPIGVVFMDS